MAVFYNSSFGNILDDRRFLFVEGNAALCPVWVLYCYGLAPVRIKVAPSLTIMAIDQLIANGAPVPAAEPEAKARRQLIIDGLLSRAGAAAKKAREVASVLVAIVL